MPSVAIPVTEVGTEEIGPPPVRRGKSEKEKAGFRGKCAALKTQRMTWALDSNRFLAEHMRQEQCHAQCDRQCFSQLCDMEESISNCYKEVRGKFKYDVFSSHVPVVAIRR